MRLLNPMLLVLDHNARFLYFMCCFDARWCLETISDQWRHRGLTTNAGAQSCVWPGYTFSGWCPLLQRAPSEESAFRSVTALWRHFQEGHLNPASIALVGVFVFFFESRIRKPIYTGVSKLTSPFDILIIVYDSELELSLSEMQTEMAEI